MTCQSAMAQDRGNPSVTVWISSRGGRSIQARELLFQSYYRLLIYQFSNGNSLRLFLWKDVSCPVPSFIHLRYTVISQNSILLCHFQCVMSSWLSSPVTLWYRTGFHSGILELKILATPARTTDETRLNLFDTINKI